MPLAQLKPDSSQTSVELEVASHSCAIITREGSKVYDEAEDSVQSSPSNLEFMTMRHTQELTG